VTRTLAAAGLIAAVIAVVAAPAPTRAQPPKPAPLVTTKPEDVGLSSERLKRIGALMGRYVQDGRLAGAVTLVARRGKVAHFEAHGMADPSEKTPLAKDALFRMASSTKPVTGVAIMMLVEEGKVRLSDPVSRFIPEFKGQEVAVEKDGKVERVPAVRPVTIQDLLTHTSGLASGGVGSKAAKPEDLRPAAGDTLAEYAKRLGKVPLDFQPGTQWRYSGLAGIDVLARVVEVASGQTFEAYLRERIFEPLGMRNTFFVVPEDQEGRLAGVWRRTAKGLEKGQPFTMLANKTYTSGAGGLTSTAEDFWRFGQMLLNGGRLGDRRLLGPRTVDLFATNHVGGMFVGQLGRREGMGFGLTVEVVLDGVKAGTRRSNGSFGWDGAFGTHFWVDPKEQLVAVLMIQTPGYDLQRDYENAVMQAIID
jgi:CubicO group peptidase (beta-lactamase class C family)